jgi:hypothetical protein
MAVQPTSAPASRTPPWQEKHIGYGLKGKKKLTRLVPYGDLRDLMVRGCQVSFSCAGAAPNKVAFYVAEQDGERLYRELARRFPAALGGWVG